MKTIRVISFVLVCTMLAFTATGGFASAATVTFKPETVKSSIFGIPANSTVKEFKAAYYNTIIDVYDANGKLIGNDSSVKIGTGFTVRINARPYTAVVMGDVNGDGVLSAVDYTLVKRTYLGTAGNFALSGIYLEAAGVKSGKKLTAVHYMMIKRACLRTYNINIEYTVEPYDPADEESGWTSGWV